MESFYNISSHPTALVEKRGTESLSLLILGCNVRGKFFPFLHCYMSPLSQLFRIQWNSADSDHLMLS